MSGGWPPPPDLASVQELVGAADVEGLIAGGAPADEYEPEGEAIFWAIGGWTTSELTAGKLLPVLEGIWRESFVADEDEVERRGLRLLGLAQQIELFFGPGAVAGVR